MTFKDNHESAFNKLFICSIKKMVFILELIPCRKKRMSARHWIWYHSQVVCQGAKVVIRLYEFGIKGRSLGISKIEFSDQASGRLFRRIREYER